MKITGNGYLVVFLAGILILSCRPAVFAQQRQADTGTVTIIRDDKLDTLVEKHIRINENRRGIDGYRIQIFFDSGANSKTRAQSIYESFRAKYPETGAYLTFKSPNYKVRVGDFRTRLDAQRFLNDLLPDYPNAFIITDQINLPRTD